MSITKVIKDGEEQLIKRFSGPIVVSWGGEECLCGEIDCVCTDNLKSFLLAQQIRVLEAVLESLNPVTLAERIVIEYANTTGREEQYRAFVRQVSEKVLTELSSSLQQTIKELRQ